MSETLQISRTSSLPHPRTRLLGRQSELAWARASLLEADVPLLTLIGPGGVGKTRLALAISRDAACAFADGVVWVDLAPVTDPMLIPEIITYALTISGQSGQPVIDTLVQRLRRRQTLLLLDNCEHLIAAAAELTAELLDTCPALQILATSRAPLHVRGEHRLSVEPLPLPQYTGDSLASLMQNASVELFVERARAVRPSFSLTETNAASVVSLCRQLEGLPLAIELAAARCAVLSPEALLAQMTDCLRVLSGGPRDLPARQRTIEATIAWSYSLLDSAAKSLLQRLSVFVGGCDLPAIASVARVDRVVVLKGLSALCDQGLLRTTEGAGLDRYAMLETVQAYALERLEQNGEAETVRDRHASHFLSLAEMAEPFLRGADQAIWLQRLESEYANLRSAMAWLYQRSDSELSWRLVGALWHFWLLQGQFLEARSMLEEALALPGTTRTAAWARAQTARGNMLLHGGDVSRARVLLEEALSVWREIGDQRGIAWTLEELMSVALNEGNVDQARELGEDALARYRGLSDDHGVWNVLWILGVVSLRQKSYQRARAELEEALRMADAMGTESGLAIMRSIGWLALAEGDVQGAAAWWEERLNGYRRSANQSGMTSTLDDLGWLALQRQEWSRAIDIFTEALELGAKGESEWVIARSLVGLAVVSADTDQFDRAAWLLGAAKTTASHGNVLDDDFYNSIRSSYERAQAMTRAALGDVHFAAVWREARNLPKQHIVRHALAYTVTSGTLPESGSTDLTATHSSLTRREGEVLRLLARRHTNSEIADALFISPRTVQTHSARILDKLGVKNRREAGAAAVRLGLV